jgi:hypothetical protein
VEKKSVRNHERDRRNEQRNEGEGNKTAAREYNEAQRRFVKSGQVEEKAREAQEALDGAQRKELEEAELVGRRHSRGEDPLLKKR